MSFNSVVQKYRDNGYFKLFVFAIIILLVLLFILRGRIVRSIFEHKCESFKNRYGLIVKADKVGFSGIRTVYVNRLSAIPEGKDTLISIDRAEVNISLTDMLFLKVNPLEIWLTNPKINLVGEKDSSNYYFLFRPQKDSLQATAPESDNGISNRPLNNLYRMLKAMFGLTTASYHVTNFSFRYFDKYYTASVSIPSFESDSKGFNTLIDIEENGNRSSLKLTGKADKRSNSIQFKAFRMGDKTPLPLLYPKLGVKLAFDTVEFQVTANRMATNDIDIGINSSVRSLEVFSEKLSDQTVAVNRGAFDFDISLKNECYLIDSTSSIDINGLKANIFIKYLPHQNRYLSFKISTREFPSQQLFESLPEGLFTNLKGIKTSGTIDFSLVFGASLNEPDSIILVPRLKTKNFGLIHYGNRNFAALNDTFSHAVFKDGVYVKTIHLDPRNRGFKRLDQISPFITNAVITSEDGAFFYNSGFEIEALKYAISENIKQKRFARGGSTITMQLVKNLYLTQNKNIFRKAEEYLIVWLIESHRIASKERLLEIYLNIIEWGPNVYGISDACQYYFKKDPADVTLDEALYLASIVPRPTKFKYLFEKDGNLKPFMADDFKFVSNKMLQHGMISENQLNSLSYSITLKGRAKDLLIDTTSFLSDSISIDEIRADRDTTTLLLQ